MKIFEISEISGIDVSNEPQKNKKTNKKTKQNGEELKT